MLISCGPTMMPIRVCSKIEQSTGGLFGAAHVVGEDRIQLCVCLSDELNDRILANVLLDGLFGVTSSAGYPD